MSRTKSIEHVVGVNQCGQKHFGKNCIRESHTISFDRDLIISSPPFSN